MNYPSIEMTQKEYDTLTQGKDQPKDFLKYVPIGFRFKTTPDETIIGEVVKGLDALEDQVGAAFLSLPERFVNRYKVKIINSSG